MLRQGGPDTLTIDRARTLAELIAALDARLPGLQDQLADADSLFNFAVNDEMLLHGVKQHPLKDGDRVEIVPTISGG